MAKEDKQTIGPDDRNLHVEIEELKTRLAPDKLAKVLDRSYLSVSSLRFYLALLSVMLTVFIAVAAYFGITSMSNVIEVRDELRDFEKFKTELEQMKAGLREISVTFNTVAAERQDEFNARELQLLFLLAQKIDPDNPTFNLNAAGAAMKFHRYDEAINYCDLVLKSPDALAKQSKVAKEIRGKAEELRAVPPKVTPETDKKGIRIGPYYTLSLHENTLNTLIQKGYLSTQEAQKIMDDSK